MSSSLQPSFADAPELVLLVEHELARGVETAGAAISIVGRGALIILFGRVKSEAVRVAAERITRLVPGVLEVDNRLEVGEVGAPP